MTVKTDKARLKSVSRRVIKPALKKAPIVPPAAAPPDVPEPPLPAVRPKSCPMKSTSLSSSSKVEELEEMKVTVPEDVQKEVPLEVDLRKKKNFWPCPTCAKPFRSQYHVQKHMNLKHEANYDLTALKRDS